MILSNKRFENIKNKIPEDLQYRLVNRERKISEEDMNMRITMINKLCDVDSKEECDIILKGIEPLSRNKTRPILLMGDNYVDVRKETKEAIVKYMTSVSKMSAQYKPKNLVYIQVYTPSREVEEAKKHNRHPHHLTLLWVLNPCKRIAHA